MQPAPFRHHVLEPGADTGESARRRIFEGLINDERSRASALPPPASGQGRPAAPAATIAAPAIVVAVRQRPLNAQEQRAGELDVISCVSDRRLVLHEPRTKFTLEQHVVNHDFTFDRVFGAGASSGSVYRALLGPHVARLASGGCVTMFAYGQTGSGKTYTMSSLVRRALDDVFALVAAAGVGGRRRLVVCISAFELYCNAVYDLLAPAVLPPPLPRQQQPLVLREDASHTVQVTGLTEHATREAEVARALVAHALAARHTGSTRANVGASSRSHAVLEILLREEGGGGGDSHFHRLLGKACLVDLAGSEQASEADHPPTGRGSAGGVGAAAAAAVEAAEINRSLLALKECIRAMGRLQKRQLQAPHCGSGGADVAADSSGGNDNAGDGGSSGDEGGGRRWRQSDEGGGRRWRQSDEGGARQKRGSVAATASAARMAQAHSSSRPRPRSAAAAPRTSGTRQLLSAAIAPARGGREEWRPRQPDGRSGRGSSSGGGGHVHVPFRGSKLTHLLRDSFTAPGAVTIMLAAVGPGSTSAEHTLNTLRYAVRLKRVGGDSGCASVAAAGVAGGPRGSAISDPTGGRSSVARRVGILWNGGREVWPDGTLLNSKGGGCGPCGGSSAAAAAQTITGGPSDPLRPSLQLPPPRADPGAAAAVARAASAAAASRDPSPAALSPIALLGRAAAAADSAAAPAATQLLALPPPPPTHVAVAKAAAGRRPLPRRPEFVTQLQQQQTQSATAAVAKIAAPLAGHDEPLPESSQAEAPWRPGSGASTAAAALDAVASLEEQIRLLTQRRDAALLLAAAAATAPPGSARASSRAVGAPRPPPPPLLPPAATALRPSPRDTNAQLALLLKGAPPTSGYVHVGSSDCSISGESLSAVALHAASAAAAVASAEQRVGGEDAPASTSAPPTAAALAPVPLRARSSSAAAAPTAASACSSSSRGRRSHDRPDVQVRPLLRGLQEHQPQQELQQRATAAARKPTAAAAALVEPSSTLRALQQKPLQLQRPLSASRQQLKRSSAPGPAPAAAVFDSTRGDGVWKAAAVAAGTPAWMPQPLLPCQASAVTPGAAASLQLQHPGHATPSAASNSSFAPAVPAALGTARGQQQQRHRNLASALLLSPRSRNGGLVGAASPAAVSLQVPALAAAGHWR